MTRVIYRREGNYINPEPLIEHIEPYAEFDPEPLIKLITRRLVEITRVETIDNFLSKTINQD